MFSIDQVLFIVLCIKKKCLFKPVWIELLINQCITLQKCYHKKIRQTIKPENQKQRFK